MIHFAYVGLGLLLCFVAPGTGKSIAGQTGSPRRLLVADDSKHRLAIITTNDSLAWEIEVGPIHDAWELENGNILLQQGWTKIVEVTPQKKVVWTYDAANSNGNTGRPVEVHAFQRLPDGRTMIVESGPARIIEVDTHGELKHEIKLKVNRPSTHSDTRLARKIAPARYLVAHENDGFVREYDARGNVVWEYEIPLFGKSRKPGHGPEAFGNAVFCAERLPNGNTLIGGGNGHCVLEVTPQKEIVWKLEQNDLPGITLAWVTRVTRLANGNTLVGNCHAGPENPQFLEVTPDKKVVWSFKDFIHFGNSVPLQIVLDQRYHATSNCPFPPVRIMPGRPDIGRPTERSGDPVFRNQDSAVIGRALLFLSWGRETKIQAPARFPGGDPAGRRTRRHPRPGRPREKPINRGREL
jgi:hypothetical protein